MELLKIIMEIILNVFILFMTIQVITIIHEFGHVISALILTKEKSRITLGKLGENNKSLVKISLRRLDIEIKGFNPFVGWTHWNASKLTKFQRIMILAGGPIISLILGIILLFISNNIGDKLLMDTFILKEIIILARNVALGSFVFTAIPIIYPKRTGYAGIPSDGYQIVKLMKFNKAFSRVHPKRRLFKRD